MKLSKSSAKYDNPRCGGSPHGLFSKFWAPFGYRSYFGTSYLGVQKWDPSFGNYPHETTAAAKVDEARGLSISLIEDPTLDLGGRQKEV